MGHHWIVELDLAAGPYRLSTEPLSATSAAGGEVVIDGGLTDEPGPLAVGDDGITITAQLPGDLVRRIVDLELTPCRLLRWEEGAPWDHAVVFSEGRVRGLEYAHPSDPVQWSILADPMGDSPMPDRMACVQDGVTWPLTSAPSGTIVPEEHDGAVYPVIYGYPGYVSQQGSEQVDEVVPVTLAQQKSADFNDTLVMLCHEPLRAGTVDSSVHLINRAIDPTQSYEQDWRIVQDKLGRSVTVCDFTRHTSHHPSTDTPSAWYAGYHPSGGGGQYRDAYSVIVDVLRQWSSVPIDWTLLQGAESLLSRYNVDTWINAPTEPWKWIGDVLLPYLPVAVRQGPRGRYLAPLPTWATSADARVILSADAGDCDRRSPISVDSASLVNEITAKYWKNAADHWRATRTYTGQDGVLGENFIFLGADSRILAHPLSALSQSRYGVRRGEVLELDWTWDPVTVLRVMADRLEQRAFPLETIRYYVHGATLAQGDVVLMTDAEVALDSRPCIVQAAPLQEPAGQVVQLRIVPPI